MGKKFYLPRLPFRRSRVFSALVLCLCCLSAQARSGKLEALLQKAEAAYTSHNDSLLAYLDQLDKVASAEKDAAAQTESTRLRGIYYFLSGEHDKALRILLDGVRLAESADVKHERIILYYEAATVYSKNKNEKVAREYMDKGVALSVQTRDTSALADGNNRIGILYEKKGMLDSALFYYNRSLQLNRAAKDSLGYSYSLENLATVYGTQRKFQTAVDLLQQALVIRRAKKDMYGISIATLNISEAYNQAGQIDSAVKYALLAEVAGRAVHFSDLVQYTYKQLSALYKAKGDYKAALEYFERGTKLSDSVYNENTSKQMAQMSARFDSEQKEQRIKVLDKQKTIRTLLMGISIFFVVVLAGFVFIIYKNRKLKEAQLRREAAYELQLKEAEARNAMQQERMRISRELHDNIGAHLTFISAGMEDLGTENAKLQQVKELTNETIKELRKTVWLINKSSVTVEEFVVKLRDFLKTISRVRVHADIASAQTEMRAELVTELFRTTQESVNNALKYSGADAIDVHVVADGKSIEVIVRDNGVGFDTNSSAGKGFGLENIKQRMQSVGGNYSVHSQPGQGTEVCLRVAPLV